MSRTCRWRSRCLLPAEIHWVDERGPENLVQTPAAQECRLDWHEWNRCPHSLRQGSAPGQAPFPGELRRLEQTLVTNLLARGNPVFRGNGGIDRHTMNQSGTRNDFAQPS